MNVDTLHHKIISYGYNYGMSLAREGVFDYVFDSMQVENYLYESMGYVPKIKSALIYALFIKGIKYAGTRVCRYGS